MLVGLGIRAAARRAKAVVSVILAAAVLSPAPVWAQSAEEFYKGRIVELFIGYTPGGGYDAYGRLVARHLGKYLPGNPSVQPRNMPGGGSRNAAAYIFGVAQKNGLSLGLVDQSLVLQQALADPTITFDFRKFNFIGNAASDNNMVALSKSKGIMTVEDAKRIESVIGSTGPNTTFLIPQTMNVVLGTKFKIVSGYPGANEMNLAQERGEIDGQGSKPWGSWKATKGDWVRDGFVVFIAQVGLTKASDLPNVPLLMDLASKPEDRELLKLLSAPSTVGRPFFTSPDVPQDRVKALRAAFDKAMKDPELIAEANKQTLDLNPSSGEELERVVLDILGTPKAVADRLAAIIKTAPPEKK